MSKTQHQPTTECGKIFEHNWHTFTTERGKVKVCDGTFRDNKVK